MESSQHNLFTRPDTFFGVCEGLGEDLGFHPNLLRIALAGVLFWSPAVALGIYAGLGLVVALTRWLAPNPASVSAPVIEEIATAEASQPVEQEEPLPLAA